MRLKVTHIVCLKVLTHANGRRGCRPVVVLNDQVCGVVVHHLALLPHIIALGCDQMLPNAPIIPECVPINLRVIVHLFAGYSLQFAQLNKRVSIRLGQVIVHLLSAHPVNEFLLIETALLHPRHAITSSLHCDEQCHSHISPIAFKV